MAMEVKFEDRPSMPMVTTVRVIVANPAPELLFNHEAGLHLHSERHHMCVDVDVTLTWTALSTGISPRITQWHVSQ